MADLDRFDRIWLQALRGPLSWWARPLVVPDDVHESLLHSRWVYTWKRMGDFLSRHLWNRGRTAQ